MGVMIMLFLGLGLTILGLLGLLNPKNYTKYGSLKEINDILEKANQEVEDAKNK